MNNTLVSHAPPRYADEAVALLGHVEAVEDEVADLIGDVDRTVNGKLADCHREISSALKQADIYAHLAVAEAIDRHREATVALGINASGVYLGSRNR